MRTLECQYRKALDDINTCIRVMQADELTQSRMYRIQYQQALKKQVEAILEKLHSDEYTSMQQYLSGTYTDAYVGTVYALHGQSVPVIMPIDQKAALKAVMTDSKLSTDLYNHLGVDIRGLKKTIRNEITRGIASGMLFQDIARNVAFTTGAPLNRAKNIVQTEGHRIQQASADDARHHAKAKGADVVKQWDSTLDGATRDTHRRLDGQIREVDEPFEMDGKEAQYPGDFGDPAEDCRCRCVALSRARSALDAAELETMKERAKFFGLDKTKEFEEFKAKYLKAAEQKRLRGNLPKDFTDTRRIGERIKQEDLQKVIERARLHGVQIGVEGNPTGGFENYCGDLAVLNGVIEQTAKQLNSDLFKNARGSKIILMYDNILDGGKAGQVIDISTFAMTSGRTITLNKFMYDDSAYLKKQYAEAVAEGLFPKGTDYTCVIAHETGHIIDKYTRGLRKKVVSVVESAAHQDGLSMDEYIAKNISIYGAHLDSRLEYHELISELNSMLNSGKKYGIIELLRKEGVFR